MIPRSVIQSWAAAKPWPTLDAVEQDLVLARLIIEVAEHPLLGDELVFRGGTCLHQLIMDRPRRYSEDLDYVRATHSGIGPIFDAVREVAAGVGLEVVSTRVGEHPKVLLRTALPSGRADWQPDFHTELPGPRAGTGWCRPPVEVKRRALLTDDVAARLLAKASIEGVLMIVADRVTDSPEGCWLRTAAAASISGGSVAVPIAQLVIDAPSGARNRTFFDRRVW